jgi:hypothetical protein
MLATRGSLGSVLGLVPLVLLAALLPPAAGAAGPAKGLAKIAIPLDDKTNPGNDDITQYSILVKDLTLADIVKVTGDPIPYERMVQEAGGVRITWGKPTTPPINNGATQTIGIELKPAAGDKVIRISQSRWYSQSQLVGKQVPLKGFAGKGDPFYQAYDDLDITLDNDSFTVHGLQFLVNVAEIPLEDLDPYDATGFGTALSDFGLFPGTSSAEWDVGTVDPGNFFYARGELIDVLTGESFGTFVEGYGFPVPEPAALLLLASTAALLRSRRRGPPFR